MLSWSNLIGNVAKEGLNYASDVLKSYIPKAQSAKDSLADKLAELAEDAAPRASKAKNNVSKYVMDKYAEAVSLSKKAEEEKKANRAKAIRNTIIATTLGFTAGAATGYVLVKKSQIKESDYVFTDDTVAESLPNQAAQEETFQQPQAPVDNKQKTYQDFNDTYQISMDGTTLIRK